MRYTTLLALSILALSATGCATTQTTAPSPGVATQPTTTEDPAPLTGPGLTPTAKPTNEPTPISKPTPTPEVAASRDEMVAWIAEDVATGFLPTAEGEPVDLALREVFWDGDLVTITTCPWFPGTVNQAEMMFTYDTAGDQPRYDHRGYGEPCINTEMLRTAAEFAVEVQPFKKYWFSRNVDPDDPELANWMHPDVVENYRSSAREMLAQNRELLYGQDPATGRAVGWATASNDPRLLAIAVHYPQDERYAWYDIETGRRLIELTHPTDRTPGNDQLIIQVLRFTDGRWWYFTVNDLDTIKCTTPDCVETLNSIGDRPGRNRFLRFEDLEFRSLEQLP